MPPLQFREKSGQVVGAGHLMRCLALGQAWLRHGGQAHAIGRCDTLALVRRVEENGVGFRHLPTLQSAADDCQATLAYADELSSGCGRRPWVVLDGYEFDSAFMRQVRASGHRLLVVDDTNHLPSYHADLLLNQNLQAEALPYRHDVETLLLLGHRYVLLRAEFAAGMMPRREAPAQAHRVLVTLGGGDAGDSVGKVLRALCRIRRDGLEVTVILGPGHLGTAAVQSEASRCSHPVQVVQGTEQMASWMAWADLAVCAGGSTLWEMAFMGVPAVILTRARNQQPGAESAAAAGIGIHLGWHLDVAEDEILRVVDRLVMDAGRRGAMGARGQELIDGRGVDRVITAVSNLETLRQEQLEMAAATWTDVYQVWHLANDPSVRSQSFSRDPIPLETHLEWFGAKLMNPQTRMWVLRLAGAVVGQIRYERVAPDLAEVHYAVAAAMRGRGLGTHLLTATQDSACRELQVDRVSGNVMEHNLASARSFLKAGFHQSGATDVAGQRSLVFTRDCPGRRNG